MKFLTHVVLAVALALFSVVSFAQMININTATAEEMDKGLKGIGPVKAAEIVKYREANGPFKSVDDLGKVTGIKGKSVEGKTLEAIKPMITVGEVAATPAAPATPAVPAVPSMPATPAMPTAPKMPVTPATSAVPAVPAVPATPAVPAVPSMPATPAMPTAPKMPVTPATSAVPATPAVPAVPAMPATPVKQP